MYGLGKDVKVITATARVGQQVSGGGLSGKQQDAAAGKLFVEDDGYINAIDVGQDNVGDEHIGLQFPANAERFGAGVSSPGAITSLAQDSDQSICNHRFVVDNQDLALLRHAPPLKAQNLLDFCCSGLIESKWNGQGAPFDSPDNHTTAARLLDALPGLRSCLLVTH